MIVGLLLVTSSLVLDISSAENETPDLIIDSSTAKHIITQMAEIYQFCKSYSDTGVVKTVFFARDDKFIDDKVIVVTNFSTAFVRPDQFRFEFSSKAPIPGAKLDRYIVWANGSDVRTWWNAKPGVKKEVSLEMAIAGATGVSSASAHTIPVLLMPKEIGGWRVTELQQLNRIADAPLKDVDCYRILGKHEYFDSDLITLWISKKTYLIYRIEKTDNFPDFRTEMTTTYEPKVNVVIDEAKLDFNAPEKGSN
jgi:outer membrane lipoprotein-sorting protein